MKRALVVFFLILGACGKSTAPQFPASIREHFLVEVRDEVLPERVLMAIENAEEIPEMQAVEVVRCIKFDIVSQYPYKIKFREVAQMKDCNGVGGYKPEDTATLFNWLDDLWAWAQERKQCFK